MSAYPTFSEHIRARYGLRWCVAQRMTERLRNKDYDTVIHPTKYAREQQEWADNHPAYLIVQAMPDSDEKRLIAKAVMRELGGAYA